MLELSLLPRGPQQPPFKMCFVLWKKTTGKKHFLCCMNQSSDMTANVLHSQSKGFFYFLY